MKYQVEYCPNSNCLEIHVDQRLIQGEIAVFEFEDFDLGEEEDFRKKAKNPDGLVSFCKTVSELDGMGGEIYFGRYDIQMTKAKIFSWGILLPHILEALRIFVAKDGQLEEKAPAKHPNPEHLEALRKQGCKV